MNTTADNISTIDNCGGTDDRNIKTCDDKKKCTSCEQNNNMVHDGACLT